MPVSASSPAPCPGHGTTAKHPAPRGQDTAGGARHGADGTLAWSFTAMSEALRRLAAATPADIPQAVAAATEAVWRVTLAGAAMSRCHPRAYGTALATLDPAARRAVRDHSPGSASSAASSASTPTPATSSTRRQPPAAALPRPQPGPGRPSPRRPRIAARHARPARTASTGHTSPAGPSDRRWDGPPASPQARATAGRAGSARSASVRCRFHTWRPAYRGLASLVKTRGGHA
jgi:hypothetical protein